MAIRLVEGVPEGKATVSWQGVWFGRKFRSRRHVEERAGTAIAEHIRGLPGKTHGLPEAKLQRIFRTCVLPMALLHGVKTWFSGRGRLTRVGKQTENSGVTDHVDTMHKALSLPTRSALPVWRTATTETIFRDACLQTIQTVVGKLLHRSAYRLHSINAQHLFHARSASKNILEGHMTGPLERPRPVMQMSACKPSRRYTSCLKKDPTEGRTKSQAKEAFLRWLGELPADDVVVYTDGSQRGQNAGYGFAIYLKGQCIWTDRGKVAVPSVSSDGETIGAWKGLEYVIGCPDLKKRRIWVCLDNTNVIRDLRRGEARASARCAYRSFQEAMATHDVRLMWCPSHCGIEGNVKADKLAKVGSQMPEVDSDCEATAYEIHTQAKKEATELSDEVTPPHSSL